jgi:hypothetical protein
VKTGAVERGRSAVERGAVEKGGGAVKKGRCSGEVCSGVQWRGQGMQGKGGEVQWRGESKEGEGCSGEGRGTLEIMRGEVKAEGTIYQGGGQTF